MAKTSLLIIEDYEPILTLLCTTLSDEFEVTIANSFDVAVVLLAKQSPSLVLLDIGLAHNSSPEQGLVLLQAMQQGKRCKTIVCTGYNERDVALRALRYGAFDILYKPLDLAVLKGVLRRASWLAELEAEADRVLGDKEPAVDDRSDLIGTSQAMKPILEAVRKMAATDLPVLIYGEAGTGKAFLASTMHQHSARSSAPFARVACEAIPAVLLERELFGGPLDGGGGPYGRVKGALESATGGTLFLEDVGALPTTLQEALVRRLERTVPAPLGVRMMASSRESLKEAVEQGRVRRDLYEKFAMHINLPALRERGSDIVVLAKLFLNRAARQQQKTITGFTRAATDCMHRYSWPGNVAELAARVQRAVVVTEGPSIDAPDLGLYEIHSPPPFSSISLKANQQRIETDLIMRAFTRSRGNLSRAAHELGISRSTLYRRIRQYGLDRGHVKLS